MLQRSNSKGFFLPLLISLFVVFFLASIKFLPMLGTRLEAGESDPVIVDLMMNKYSINTGSATDSITVYTRIRAVTPKTIISSSISIAPSGCEGSACSTSPFSQSKNSSLMTEGCTLSGLPDGFYLDGITNCGDSTDGIYSATFDIPGYSLVGDWKIYSIEICDEVEAACFEIQIPSAAQTLITAQGERAIAFIDEGAGSAYVGGGVIETPLEDEPDRTPDKLPETSPLQERPTEVPVDGLKENVSTDVPEKTLTPIKAGVPNTGLGGIENSSLTKYFGWLK